MFTFLIVCSGGRNNNRPLAVNTFFFDPEAECEEEEEEAEGGGEVRVVVSGPWDGDTDIWRLEGEARLKVVEPEPGMLRTGGKDPSDTEDESGTLTVFTRWVEDMSGPG